MAFYPDELSPIDRSRVSGKLTDTADIKLINNRRQWKSLVLGKKDMNSFATITEEKEEEISSDESRSAFSIKDMAKLSVSRTLCNKNITFPKPRKYITSRVWDRKDEVRPVTPPSLISNSSKEILNKTQSQDSSLDGSDISRNLKPGSPEVKQLLKAKQSREFIMSNIDYVENYSFNEVPIETQWNEAMAEAGQLKGWKKSKNEKLKIKIQPNQKFESAEIKNSRTKSTNSINSSNADIIKDSAIKKKKENRKSKKKTLSSPSRERSSENKALVRPGCSKGKSKAENEKGLNMKEMVHVYKNLAYGSKEEIKSFVERLSYVTEDDESDRSLLPMKNLKALENKIKNFAKKSSKVQEKKSTPDKNSKNGKLSRNNRKAHIERLARHKVVKAPQVSNYNYLKNSLVSNPTKKAPEMKDKSLVNGDREPWRHVGMSSILDKTYFVYPVYPPSYKLKKTEKKKKIKTKDINEDDTKVKVEEAPLSTSKPGPKVNKECLLNKPQKGSRIRSGPTRSMNTLNVSMSTSNKSMTRSSATTVCTVEFPPAVDPKAPVENLEPIDPSLLVYLHGSKAIHVKSPYADRQFSRVKFFRKDGKGIPLVKGLDRKVLSKSPRNVSIRNIRLPETLSRIRSFDLLDFDEDIQNISDFLHSQKGLSQKKQEEKETKETIKRSEKVQGSKKTSSLHRRTAQPIQEHHEHQEHQTHQLHQTYQAHQEIEDHQHSTIFNTLSPEVIINEISKSIKHLQYLPDTEENRKIIADYFDELDHRIEASKRGHYNMHDYPSDFNTCSSIPILGY